MAAIALMQSTPSRPLPPPQSPLRSCSSTMAALAPNFLLPKYPIFPSFSGNSLKPPGKNAVKLNPINLTLIRIDSRRSCTNRFTVRAEHSNDAGRSGSASAFIGGFALGGLIVGTLGCVFAPQISKALSGADRKDLMRKLPKFIYDEDKALERTRKVLTEKIAQLNSAIDDVMSQLRADDGPSEASVASDELEASIYD